MPGLRRGRVAPAMLAMIPLVSCVSGEPARQAAPTAQAVSPQQVSSAALDAGCAGLVDAALAGKPAPGLAWLPVGSAVVDNDLGLPMAADAESSACTLLVDAPRPGTAAPRRLLERERVRSVYQDGVDLVANPERKAAERDLARIKNGNRRTGNVLSTGVASIDLIGAAAESAIAGIDLLVRMDKAAELRRQVEAMPEEVARPRNRRYAYDRVHVEASRSASTRIAWHDRDDNSVREAVAVFAESRRFHLDEGRRAEDAAEAGDAAASLAEVAAWEQALPPVRLSALLARLRAAGYDRDVEVGAVLAGWRDGGSGTAAEPALPAIGGSLVRIDSAGGAGAGFFVGPEQVLTLERLVAGSDLVRVAGGDGRAGFALVERRDRAVGLALLRMAAPASALAIADSGPPSGRARLAWPGGPAAGVDGRLLADPAGGGTLWQPDVAVLPLPGTPAMSGGEVLAIVTDPGEAGSQLLPASRLRTFLAGGVVDHGRHVRADD